MGTGQQGVVVKKRFTFQGIGGGSAGCVPKGRARNRRIFGEYGPGSSRQHVQDAFSYFGSGLAWQAAKKVNGDIPRGVSCLPEIGDGLLELIVVHLSSQLLLSSNIRRFQAEAEGAES